MCRTRGLLPLRRIGREEQGAQAKRLEPPWLKPELAGKGRDGGIDRSKTRNTPWFPTAFDTVKCSTPQKCMELASRMPSWPAASCGRINRPDIWLQAIRSQETLPKPLQAGGRPHMGTGFRKRSWSTNKIECHHGRAPLAARRFPKRPNLPYLRDRSVTGLMIPCAYSSSRMTRT